MLFLMIVYENDDSMFAWWYSSETKGEMLKHETKQKKTNNILAHVKCGGTRKGNKRKATKAENIIHIDSDI